MYPAGASWKILLANIDASIFGAEFSIMGMQTVTAGAFFAPLIGAGAGAIAMAGVFTALGAGYYEAREAARDENTASGFSQGYVMGLLGWQGRHVVDRFGRQYVLRIYQTDEALNTIRVNAYNLGLKSGFLAGRSVPDSEKKNRLTEIRKRGGIKAPGTWSRNDQISYVIELAAAARRYGLVRPE